MGPYEILAALGAGGMGEVYRATDSNLKRSVAIKVLPASVAGDADRLARIWYASFRVIGDAFLPGKPQLWSATSLRPTVGTSPYDIHPDGKRVAAAADHAQNMVQDHVVIMSNFFDYLRQIAPVKK